MSKPLLENKLRDLNAPQRDIDEEIKIDKQQPIISNDYEDSDPQDLLDMQFKQCMKYYSNTFSHEKNKPENVQIQQSNQVTSNQFKQSQTYPEERKTSNLLQSKINPLESKDSTDPIVYNHVNDLIDQGYLTTEEVQTVQLMKQEEQKKKETTKRARKKGGNQDDNISDVESAIQTKKRVPKKPKKKLNLKLKVNILATSKIQKVERENISMTNSDDEYIDMDAVRSKYTKNVQNQNEFITSSNGLQQVVKNDQQDDYDFLSERSEFQQQNQIAKPDSKIMGIYKNQQPIYSQQVTNFERLQGFGTKFKGTVGQGPLQTTLTPQISKAQMAQVKDEELQEMKNFLADLSFKVSDMGKAKIIRYYNELIDYRNTGKLPDYLVQ
eukprot:403374066